LSYLQTQAEILKSPKVARLAVAQLKLANNPAALATLGMRATGSARADARLEDELVERLLRDLKVEDLADQRHPGDVHVRRS